MPFKVNPDTGLLDLDGGGGGGGAIQGLSVSNIGISYSSPTFTIFGADGTALSASNPGIIVLPSKSNPGQFVKYQITANQTFDDASGTSDITGNLFGFTTSVAITVDVPFFIYAVANDDEDTIQFMISRIPSVGWSPTSTKIGAPDDAVSDTQDTFWSLSNIDETLYDNNPCICIGGFRMKMSASDDWTVQPLAFADDKGPLDGIGKYFIGYSFTIPTGQFGADSGTLCIPNGGTCPVFNSLNQGNYTFTSIYTPMVQVSIEMSGDGGTDGSGAVSARVAVPFIFSSQQGTGRYVGHGRVQTPATSETALFKNSGTANVVDFNLSSNALTGVQWGDFTNGSRRIEFFFMAKIRVTL